MQKIQLHSNYKHLEQPILDYLKQFNDAGTYVLKGSRNSIKKITIQGVELNVKQFKKPNAFNAFVYKFIRKSKAKRSFEYANLLLEKGIQTPFPVAYYEETNGLGLGNSFYISLHVNYDFDFRVLIHQPKFPDRNNILEQFTAFTFKLHENQINFLDHSPGNTLIINRGEGKYDFFLIDLNRMTFKSMNFSERMHNFRRLWLSKAMIKIMAAAYAKLYNKTYDQTHSLMLKHSRDFQRKVDAKKLRRSGRKMRFGS